MKRILVCEDEDAIRDFVVINLVRSGYDVVDVSCGEDAVKVYTEQNGNFDVALLDIMMPGTDGLTCCRRIREKDPVPIILLTAKDTEYDYVNGILQGGDDYLTKPFVTKELLARIRAMTRRQSDLQDNALVYGDLRLDRTSFELISKKGKLLLTAKEFQIMEMFMMNPKCILSAEQLMDRVWGLESETEISVVWTYISYLRKKLKTLDSSVTIKAVRNVGYTLEVPDA